ncbi:hypothetical protein TWF730_010363 [Orbilia blumenaviensis]|uniref:Uncharacterized protein n=1 Tax=Orbilia blumenaviensis TaxID=1796055 RepID=A0AAV9UP97_9PEZI
MPPSRNSTLRTERTHEENQERAYIAASHRTDRSLEARMESARRASEIHKQRTGKHYKISEESVLAGEVYMDDDEELPAPYYQLDQLLRPDAPNYDEFRRRLIDYLSVNAGMRRELSSAIEAAIAQKGGPAQEGSGIEQGSRVQRSPFSPTVFAPPYQGPASFSTSESSSTPTQSTTVANSHSQVNMQQFQTPISVHGTQFYMGPVGLGTLPPHYYQGTHLARRQTAPTIRIPQQAPSPVGAPNPYSAVLSAEQYQALSASLSSRRPSTNTVDMTGSPMSDVSMTSFRTGANPTTPSASCGSPEPLSVRKMSIPCKIPESPLRKTTFSPHLPQQQRHQQQIAIDPPNTKTATLVTQDVNKTVASTAGETNKSIPPSPAVKRRASAELTADEPSVKSVRADGSPITTTSCSPTQEQSAPQTSLSDSDFGILDFSLPQNTRDILYGSGMYFPGNAALSFGGNDLEGKQNSTPGTVSTPFYTGQTPGSTNGPIYNFTSPEMDLTGSIIDQTLNSNMPLTFNMDFSKYNDNSDSIGNIEEMWQECFLQKGIHTHTANTGDTTASPANDNDS